MHHRRLIVIWLRGLAAVLIAGVLGVAHAGPPQVGGQAPGWYRMMLGEFEITALSDGTVDLPVDKLLTNTTEGRIKALLARSYLTAPVETSVNGYLVNTGTRLVLIDTGAAGQFGPTLGKLMANLRASGYQPEQVDEVYLTHMHLDHVGGLMTGDKMAFPNAVVRADRRESDFWLSKVRMVAAPESAKGDFQGVMASLDAYVAAGKYKPFDGDTELVPGIRAVPAHGHTPGHSIFVVESQGKRMVMWGDLMHVAAVQFVQPSATIQFDLDSKAAAPQRMKNFADASKKGYHVAIAHAPFPGIGRLRPDGPGYTWIPANHTAGR